MSVKNFKFVSPGVFINEIDNSFRPKRPENIGPVVIGRSSRGMAMEPVKVEAYSEFINLYGDTVPGNGGGDVYLDGNNQSPMYGTFAAKAFMNANVAPLTYLRLLGQQTSTGKAAGGDAAAGWKTDNIAPATATDDNSGNTNGGAYGLFLFKSGSQGTGSIGGTKATGIIKFASAPTTGSVIFLTSSLRSLDGDGNLLTITKTIKGYVAATASTGMTVGGLNTSSHVLYHHGKAGVAEADRPASAIESLREAINSANGHNGGTIDSVFELHHVTGSDSLNLTASVAGTGSNETIITKGAGATITVSGMSGGEEQEPQQSRFGGNLGTGSLAAIWYLHNGKIQLSGNVWGKAGSGQVANTASAYAFINSDSNGNYQMVISGTAQGSETFTFNFNDNSENFIRNQFNTNPQLKSSNTKTFFPAATQVDYWLGETFEQNVRNDGFAAATSSVGIIMALNSSSADSINLGNMKKQAAREGRTSWFIGQDLGVATSFKPQNQQKLFRLIGRGHGEWLHRNLKVSIERIRQSNTNTSAFGSFSVVIRKIMDTDAKVEVVERFDNLNLDPTSPNFVARKIGDMYTSWDSTNKRLRYYGEYANLSKYVRVEMNTDVEAGATDPALLPFGYFGPPKIKATNMVSGRSILSNILSASYVEASGSYAGGHGTGQLQQLLGGTAQAGGVTASFDFPTDLLRSASTDGGITDPTNAYFGWRTTRTATSNTPDASVANKHRLLYPDFPADPTTAEDACGRGVDSWGYVFSLDDVQKDGATSVYYYRSGSRAEGVSVSAGNTYKTLLDANYNRFTAPFWGGFDGFDITKPDPLANSLMSDSSTEDNSYVYHTFKRAMQTLADPSLIDFNLLVTPGLTHAGLTEYAIQLCEDRADALTIVDLPTVYTPMHEEYKDKAERPQKDTVAAANSLKDRRIDSSYGCTFYPWVQTRDGNTGQLVWVPPSVAMMGVLASSESKSDVWFAPAGFNRGGLTEGAAGIPITNVSERLSSKERDTLYDARINPIASFPSSGIVVFGQKTLQERPSALDRINVRRLVIFLKKQISVLSTQILFEQNVQATWDRFKGLVEPFLANVKTRFGISDYRLILDESTTTPDLIDQNIMYAKILIKPARAIEFIAIDFVILSTGASFDD
tara:strand:+ start:4876 stop:8283 length:3408 start_codon:yes stop_codon:yes gene_type:complete